MRSPTVRHLACLGVALGLLGLGGRLAAQAAPVVRGRVILSDGVTRAAGVIVVADAPGGAAARTLTNQRGDYLITLPAAGRYGVRVLRVGFRPTVGPTVNVAAGDTAIANVQLADVAISLRAVTVREDNVCRTTPDSGALVARAWEEARKAIMSSQLAPSDAPLVAEWIEYQRTLDPTGRIVRAQRVRSTRSPTTHAFRSAPAAMLAERGYVTLDGDETTFHAPDGDVLLSDSFAGTHCFQIVQPARGADTLVGVGFQPARDRRDARDIAGTFWLDRRTAELRWLEYRYVNLPAAAERATPGGRVEFLRLGTGSWLIGPWHIRMPELTRATSTPGPDGRRVVRGPAGGALRAIQVTGGQVSRVTRGDSSIFSATGAALDVQLVAPDRFATVTGGTVELDGTDYVAVVDGTGRARLSPVLEGRYSARIRTALMDSLGVPSMQREIEITARPRRDSIQLQSADELLRTICRDSAKAGTAMVHGTVRTPEGRPVPDAAVVVAWQANFKIFLQGNADRVSAAEETVGAFSDANGRWRLCGIPREAPIVVRVKTLDGSDAIRTRVAADEPIRQAHLVPRKVAASVDQLLPATNRALVEFSVSNDTGALVVGAIIEVDLPGGTGTRTLTTGPTGLALIPDVAPGRLVVRARKIGYKAGRVSATVAAGRNTVPIILSGFDAPLLNAVRIIGDKRTAGGRLDEFETRRLNGLATRSITRAEIEKRNPVDAWQMLTNVPSIKIAEQGGVVIARSMRVENPNILGPSKPCFMRVMIDGMLKPEDIFESDKVQYEGKPVGSTGFATDLAKVLPSPDEIYGIEVFAGPASIPVQYGGSGSSKWCGLIAIWTR